MKYEKGYDQYENVKNLLNETILAEEERFDLFTKVSEFLYFMEGKDLNKSIVKKLQNQLGNEYTILYNKKEYRIGIRICEGNYFSDSKSLDIAIAEYPWDYKGRVRFSFSKFKEINSYYFNDNFYRNRIERLYNLRENLSTALEKRDVFLEVLKQYSSFQESIPWFEGISNVFPQIKKY